MDANHNKQNLSDDDSQPTSRPNLSVQIGDVHLNNPVFTSSGTCGYGTELAPFTDLSQLGAFTTKSITLEPRTGNPPERIVETESGMLNAIGLANVGLERFIAEKVPVLSSMQVPVFVNVAGHSIEEYVEVCRRLDPIDSIAGIELNVSCPNVSDGMQFGTDAGLLRELVSAVRRVISRRTFVVKLSPNVTDITVMARAAIDAGTDAISMVNTFVGMAIDIETRRPILANRTGGLSGPAIKPMAVNLVNRVYTAVAKDAGVPIIGMGGIQCWQDAVEFILAGASAVSIGTALFVDPTTPQQITDGLSGYLVRSGFSSLSELVGQVR